MLDDLAQMKQLKLEEFGDTEIATRSAQYEMAFHMQSSGPELTDRSKEPEQVVELYGPDSKKPGTYAANCLLARRLAERKFDRQMLTARLEAIYDDVAGRARSSK